MPTSVKIADKWITACGVTEFLSLQTGMHQTAQHQPRWNVQALILFPLEETDHFLKALVEALLGVNSFSTSLQTILEHMR